MPDTSILLLIALAALGLALVWRHRAQRSVRERQRIEDALKHLFDQEYRGRHASLASLKGALRLPDSPVLALVARMQALDLVRARGQEFDLTPEGERLALQIVRAHRLLERYFADEARLPLGQVHAAAERREHSLSAADVDRLSAELGHPSRPARRSDPDARGRRAAGRGSAGDELGTGNDGPHRPPRR
jgi:Mn-dependent DtxR family transcriptional regulator